MSNASEENRQAGTGTRTVPPLVGCPLWCKGGHVPWEPDGSEFATSHFSPELASPGAKYTLTLYAVDFFYDGTLEIRPTRPALRLNNELLDPEDALLLAA